MLTGGIHPAFGDGAHHTENRHRVSLEFVGSRNDVPMAFIVSRAYDRNNSSSCVASLYGRKHALGTLLVQLRLFLSFFPYFLFVIVGSNLPYSVIPLRRYYFIPS